MIPTSIFRFSAAAAMVAALAGAGAADAATYFVSPCGQDAWIGVQPGCMGPLGPKRTIQAAIDVAVNGDQISVLPGTYVGTIDLNGKAITITGAGGAGATILDGHGDGPVVLLNGGEGPGTIIEGLTIRNGHSAADGGGMLIAFGSPIVRDCVFEENEAEQHGGAIGVVAASPQIIDCQFIDNLCGAPPNVFTRDGGAIRCLGGSPTISGCDFTDNRSLGDGGAISIGANTIATITDCDFDSNLTVAISSGEGGALHVTAGQATVSQCDFTSNTAVTRGGAVFIQNGGDVAFSACTFTENSCQFATPRAGGAVLIEGAEASFFGCEFQANVAGLGCAIRAVNSTLSAILCGFHSNTWLNDNFTHGSGGAIDSVETALELSVCSFTGNDVDGDGGAVRVQGGSADIGGCLFSNNTAVTDGVDDGETSDGGAIYAAECDLVVSSCTFTGNAAAGGGGGVEVDSLTGQFEITDSTFTENTAINGAGLNIRHMTGMVVGCEFTDNACTNVGGGVGTFNSETRVEACAFTGNHADGSGGALGSLDSVEVIGCSFTDNTADRGGAVAAMTSNGDPLFIGCEFDGNSAVESGGAAIIFGSATMRFVNSVVSGNSAPFGAGALFAENSAATHFGFQIMNSAIVNNTGGGVIVEPGSAPTVIANSILRDNPSGPEIDGVDIEVFHSNIQGGAPGAGNIDANPMFINPVVGNYRLQAGSPCIDTGVNARVPLDAADLDVDGDLGERTPMDFDGAPRFMDNPMAANLGCGSPAIVDMGPFESLGAVSPDLSPADLNGDGVVNSSDLAIILGTWGMCETECCPGDLNLDGAVDSTDLAFLLGLWG